ncbi:unnamed protein product [Meganyctiphanes norvegica]|uniref:Uncharacterized protein n=1 Tax=Meganyctiphanes norvegica TaxID=48144 RepID=A0AAV2Q7G7_MEGNR
MKPQGVVPCIVCLLITLANVELALSATNDHINLIDTQGNDISRLKNLQNRFLDIVGNSTSGVDNFQDLINIFHTDAGNELGRLFIEGFLVGATQDDSMGILTDFWGELQHRLPAQLVKTIHGYGTFFDGLDPSTFALTMEKLFEKDFLGNSLAGIPLGQLVDMVQPAASKYGIDIKSVINSLIGKGDNNVRDVIITTIQSMDIPSLVGKLFNSTSKSSVQTQNNVALNSNDKKDKIKSNRKDNPLQLFKPLIANLIKENGLELDVDAVIEVASPFLSGDMLSQILPMITSMMGGKSGGAAELLPLLAGLMGGGGSKKNTGAAMLGGLGALMGGMGEKGQMDPMGLLSMASMFMGNGGQKKSATGEKGQMDPMALLSMASMFMGNGGQKKAKPTNINGKKKVQNEKNLDLGALASLASQMAGNNNLDMGSLLNVASTFMGSANKKKGKVADKIQKKPSTEKPASKPNTETPVSKPSNQNVKTASPPKDIKATKNNKNLIDIFEPVILSMQTDKQCNKKISDAIRFGKAVLSKKMVSISELGKMLPSLVSSVVDVDALNNRGLNIPSMMGAMQQAFKNSDWKEFLNSIENEDFRQTLFRTITPHISELLILVSSQEVQQNLYNVVVPKIDGFFTGYGLAGLTLENFPGRIGPMLGMFSRGWNLPFNPTTLLVPLKEYLIGLRKWATSSLEDIKEMEENEVSLAVMKALENDFSESMVRVMEITRNNKPHCLPQLLCELNQQHDDDTLKSAVTRAASVFLGGAPVLETSEAKLLLEIVQSANYSEKPCKVRFPGKCNSIMKKESLKMETQYENLHQIHEDL